MTVLSPSFPPENWQTTRTLSGSTLRPLASLTTSARAIADSHDGAISPTARTPPLTNKSLLVMSFSILFAFLLDSMQSRDGVGALLFIFCRKFRMIDGNGMNLLNLVLNRAVLRSDL